MAYLNDRNYSNRNYIDGNVVRVTFPERIPEPERRRETSPVRKPKKRNKAKRLSPAFAAFSAAAGIVVMIAVVNCISVQTDMTTKLDNISVLEKELLDMKEVNSQIEAQISLLTDVTYIYETATTKLGMVPADDSRIIYYDKTESEYVRQYEYIPE